MSHSVTREEIHAWCTIPVDALQGHPELRTPFRLVEDSAEMGRTMADELAAEIKRNNAAGRPTRAIVPCGPKAWYEPFALKVNEESIDLRRLVVFHMDECLDWQGQLLPRNDPHNFRTFMEAHFYGPIRPELNVPESQRFWPTPYNVRELRAAIDEAPVDITLGGWGQDGHVAYNQARRHPYSPLTLDDLRKATVRVQDNNWDTVVALAQRSLGTAYQLAPPMSVTLGIRECLSAAKVRIFSDTGAWKQTALRVALFSPPTVDYPMTLLQEHADAVITATRDTARHAISEHPEWDFFGSSGYHDA